MARRPRHDRPGSWHHVMNRGVAKRPLFEDLTDARFFLARLADQVRRGRIEVHAYCLMTTHFHLLVRSPVGALSEVMRLVQNEHSRHFNRRRKRDGTLVRGRFSSKPVRSLVYRRTLVRYIDANPVRAKLVPTSFEYLLGSASAYQRPSGPPWLSREWVEEEVRRITGNSNYSGPAYQAVFSELAETEATAVVRARLKTTAVQDPLDDLVGAAPPWIRAWLQRKARLADGCDVGLPICGRRSLETELRNDEQRHGPWMVRLGTQWREGFHLARIGLLRDLCGLSWNAIAVSCGQSVSQVRRAFREHRAQLEISGDYSSRVARVAKASIDRCFEFPLTDSRAAALAKASRVA